MGKRQIGEMQPSELAVMLLVADLASIPMQTVDIPLVTGLIPMATLLVLEIAISYAALKSKRIRGVIFGAPSIIINNGRIDQVMLKKLRFNLEDLFEELHLKNIDDINDVQYAILETNGKLSVFLKPEKRPLTPKDMNIPVQNNGLPLIVVADGVLDKNNMSSLKLSQTWLNDQMKKHKAHDVNKIFLLCVDENKNIYMQVKE